MKQYKHKQTGRIAKQFQDTGWYNIILDDGSTHPLMGYFIENTNDWEEVKPEPKYEVGDWVKLNDNNYVVQIDLIGNNDEILLKFSGDKVSWVHESQIKCKVKPIELWFNLYRNSYNDMYYANDFYKSKLETERKNKNVVLSYLKFHSTHSITIYEEVEE